MATPPPYQIFGNLFRYKALRDTFENKVAGKGGAGIDRLSPDRFELQKQTQIKDAYRGCRNGSYRFTPYSQILLPRGQSKTPRVLSIPTVRDRIVLHQLKSFLHGVFPECVSRMLPNEYIRRIKAAYPAWVQADAVFYRCDITSFFPSICWLRLEGLLRTRIHSRRIRTIIMRAVKNSTVPAGYRRSQRQLYRPT